MRKTDDLRELIAEYSTSRHERSALEAVLSLTQQSLEAAVPHRPEFKDELRRQLIAEARRTLLPWYRRPPLVGTAVATVAALLILGVGLQLAQNGTDPQQPANPENSGDNPSITRVETPVVPHLTTFLGQLPVISLPDEVLDLDAMPVGTGAAPDVSRGLYVLRLPGWVDALQFSRLSTAMGFDPMGQNLGDRYVATQGDRILTVTTDGRVEFTDRALERAAAADSGGAVVDPKTAARRFLDRAFLPVPALAPHVEMIGPGTNGQRYIVTYTPMVDGRPVVNGRTVLHINSQGDVMQVEAFVQASPEVQGAFAALPAADAIGEAERRGGARFTQADLVYVRASFERSVYLQPYWRVYGVDQTERRILRYVPALSR